MSDLIEPGMRVRHPGQPDWGIGQVQSVIGQRVTVNFEHAGKLLINAAVVALEAVEDADQPQGLASGLAPRGGPGPNP
jgi:FKBP-type peptidyl-prolyl cis-trans isomerase 2